MRTFKVDFVEVPSVFNVSLENSESMDMNVDEFVGSGNYEILRNKPSINGVDLSGNKTSEDLKIVLRGTVEYWNSQPSLMSRANTIYVYTDYQTKDNGDGTYTITPAIKIGDGTSYLIDMPFMGATDPIVQMHIENETVHVTAEEKEFWNKKWSGYTDESDPENIKLIFTTN